MGKSWLLTVAGCVVFLAGCAPTPPDESTLSAADPTSATQQEPSQVSVPATRLDIGVDQTYELKDTASVTNDVWADGTFGKVSVMARRGVSQSNRTPLLTGTLMLGDGSTVECRQFRSTIWTNFDDFEALDLRCTRELDLSTVRSVDVTNA